MRLSRFLADRHYPDCETVSAVAAGVPACCRWRASRRPEKTLAYPLAREFFPTPAVLLGLNPPGETPRLYGRRDACRHWKREYCASAGPSILSRQRATMTHEPLPSSIVSLERPQRALWTYYVLSALATGPGVFVMLPYLYFRYHTLRYRFDEEGIHMRVGIFFRQEVNLTYARIQDIHLRSNLVQRWLGLANVQIQTASGSSNAELMIEGFKEFEAIRDFLYTRMRGYQAASTADRTQSSSVSGSLAVESDDMIALLQGIRDELRRTRELLEANPQRNPPAPSPPGHV